MSISKVFKPNFVYFLTNERYITYQTGFSFSHLGHAQGWDLGVPWGVGGQKNFFSEIQPELVCLIQNISDGFFILSPGSCPRGGTWGY